MADEPTNWELARRLDDIRGLLTGVVVRAEYLADKSAADRRIDGLERRLDETRTSGFARMREIEQRVEDRAREVDARFDKHEEQHQANAMSWRTLLWTGVLPAVATILAVIITYWLSHH